MKTIKKKHKIKIERIQSKFPDCIAYIEEGDKEKEIRIEFEFKSKNFQRDKHNPKGCDWIECWENNWNDAPKKLKIVELRKEYGLGFNIWIQPVKEYSDALSETKHSDDWSVPSQAHKGDLLLFYHATPKKYIKDIFILLSDPKKEKEAGWREGSDYGAEIKRICTLKSPIYWEEMKNHGILSTASFIRGNMRGRPKVTEYWATIYEMIIERNKHLKDVLKKYKP